MARKTGKRAKHERKQLRVIKHGGDLDEFVKNGPNAEPNKKCQLCKRFFANHNSLTNHLKDAHGVTEKKARKLLAQQKLDKCVKDMDDKLGVNNNGVVSDTVAKGKNKGRSSSGDTALSGRKTFSKKSNFALMGATMDEDSDDDGDSCSGLMNEEDCGCAKKMEGIGAVYVADINPTVVPAGRGENSLSSGVQLQETFGKTPFGTSFGGGSFPSGDLSAHFRPSQAHLFSRYESQGTCVGGDELLRDQFLEQCRETAELGLLHGLTSLSSHHGSSSHGNSSTACSSSSNGASSTSSPNGWDFVGSGITRSNSFPSIHPPPAAPQSKAFLAAPNSLESWCGMDLLPPIPEDDSDDDL